MLSLYNTFSKEREPFNPIDPKHVRFYVCGPTVYDRAHLGNARPVVVFDVLYRVLTHLYPRVTYVRNITDVDDKINKRSQETGEDIRSLTDRTIGYYHEDIKALKALPPTLEPRATDHIQEMIDMIQTLIEKGHAYEQNGHVLFQTESFPDYGGLSKKNLEDMIAGARIDVASYKKNPSDFVLWKPSSDDLPGWESPWGTGRPGWHIECSAMSAKYLGKTFDIHGGGIDLVFPHHENEIAQSCCANDTNVMANIWMHNGHLTINSEKMSKSLGNFFTVNDLLKEWEGEVVRLALLKTHYRQPLDWNDDLLKESKQNLNRFYEALRPFDTVNPAFMNDDFLSILQNDLNTPKVLAHLHDLITELNKTKAPDLAAHIKACGQLLGLLEDSAEAWFQKGSDNSLSAEKIESLIQERANAKKEKDFQRADDIRNLLMEQGIVLQDSPTGTTWKRED